jgi:hypothetical protein
MMKRKRGKDQNILMKRKSNRAFFICWFVSQKCMKEWEFSYFIRTVKSCFSINLAMLSSVADPWKFGTDPDPRIHPLTNGSGFESICRSGSCFFPAIFNKNLFSKSFFAYYFLKVHLHHFSHRCHKTVGINVFLTIFAWEKDLDPFSD